MRQINMAAKADTVEEMEPTELSKENLETLPNNTNQNWFKDKGLRKLNLGIFFMYSTASSAGYIGNLVNSLLVLPECEYARPSR
jgi:hypothetical protein